MIKLKKGLEKINNIIPKGSNIFYFDYPVYDNVGDMLIWKGTERFFKECNIHVRKRYSYHLVNYKLESGDMLEIPKDTVIVCQGGGNFGDLYPIHQNLRKLLTKNYPDHRIVILPQSIFYEDTENIQKDFELFSEHRDFHLFLRDSKSFVLASKFIDKVYLCSDMAHALYPIRSRGKGKLNTLYLLRKDKEMVESYHNNTDFQRLHEFDWAII
ncbi:polysaccharide pyruvyl transferase family protein [Virgibacillus sp. DJP39]|uniref:polysaccharide pyruvyl transferase family protein n=1 Tax=Virgibacillus sp. DJP39 TaxID=3409790 RepID=UPI003BB7E7AE